MAKSTKVGYTPGNIGDKVKYANQEILINSLPTPNNGFFYIELHSGEGIYKNNGQTSFPGSAYRAFNLLTNRNVQAHLFLHEVEEITRAKLMVNMANLPGVSIGENWKEKIDSILEKSQGKPTLIFSDPTKMTQHLEVVPYIPKFLGEGRSLFMFVPEGIGYCNNRAKLQIGDSILNPTQLAQHTISLVKSQKVPSIDLIHPGESDGAYESVIHNIIATADESLLEKLAKSHESQVALEVLPKRLATFISKNGPLSKRIC